MRTILSILVFLAITHSAIAQGCTASAWAVERAGQWEEGGLPRRVYDLQITNTGSCTISGWVSVFLEIPQGNKLVESWGFNSQNGQVDLYGSLAVGQTFSGAGFIWAGQGSPNPTLSGIGSCSCTSSTGSAGQISTTGAASTTGSTIPWVNTPTYKLGLNILVLVCTISDPEFTVVNTTLLSVGAQFDIISQADRGAENFVTADLYNSDNSGKYYAVVMTMKTCWSSDQINQVNNYLDLNNVKMVVLVNLAPDASSGMAVSSFGVRNTTGALTFADAIKPWATHANLAASMPVTSGTRVCLATITDSTRATAAFNIKVVDSSSTFVAASIVTYPTGVKVLEFYIESADWAPFAPLVGHTWLNWVTNGIYLGLRRIEINVQVDDIFMNTGMFDNVTKDESNDPSNTYRITPQDLDWIHTWQAALNARAPAGTDFVLTFPFNGETVGERFTTDTLYIKAKSLRDSFFWESHTWSHPYLDDMSYENVTLELSQQMNTWYDLFGGQQAMIDNPMACKRSMVTPSISGLLNGDALKAIYDFGYHAVVGDNTKPEYRPSHPYHGWYTTEDWNGWGLPTNPGIYVLPRWATEIFYDASLPVHIENLYNFVYNKTYFTALNFTTIVDLDTNNALLHLLNYRQDPFMMHQANMRVFNLPGWGQTTLLSYWTDVLVNKLMLQSSFPVLSHSHDDLATRLQAREARDACDFDGFLVVDANTNNVLGVHASTAGTCEYAISGLSATATDSVTNENYGLEKTVWIDMTPGNTIDLPITNTVTMNM